MRGDFSRLPAAMGSGQDRLLMQQGRVQLDADWNKQAEVIARQIAGRTVDMVGQSGAPAAEAGFAVRALGGIHLGPVLASVLLWQAETGNPWPEHDLTLEFWLRPADPLGPLTLVHMAGGKDWLDLVLDGQGCPVARWGRAEVAHEARHELRARLPLTPGQFAHLAFILEGGEAQLYLNGRLVGGPTSMPGQWIDRLVLGQGPLPHGNGPGETGQRDGTLGTGGAWVDDIRLWRRALTPEAIRDGISGRIGPHAPGLMLRRRFDRSTGTGAGQGDRIARSELWLTAGRYYLDGQSCDNPAHRRIDLPDALAAALAEPDASVAAKDWFVQLDVIERVVSAVEDPAIAEVALGGVDTTVRVRSDWRVAVLPLDQDQPATMALPAPEMRARRRMVGETLTNTLYRIEICHAGWLAGSPVWPGQAERLDVVSHDPVVGKAVLRVPVGGTRDFQPGRPVEVLGLAGEATRDGVALLARVLAGDGAADTITVSPVPEGLRPGGQLLLRRIASFLWARDNASVAARVLTVSGQQVRLSAGPRAASLIRPGHLAEISADGSPRHLTSLVRIDAVERGSGGMLALTVSPAPDMGQVPALLTLWQPLASQDALGAVAIQLDHWHSVENGVEVCFNGLGTLETADYWGVPARDLTQDILWPVGTTGPVAVPPLRARQHRVTLARIQHGPDGLQVEDQRRVFPALGDLALPGPLHPGGSVRVPGDLQVLGDAWVEGVVQAGRFQGRLGSGMVDTDALQDRAVTDAKLARPGGLVPDGAVLAFDSAMVPTGYEPTGLTIEAEAEDPQWHELTSRLPQPGPVQAAVLAGQIYLLWEDGGFGRHDSARDGRTVERLAPPEGHGTRRRGASLNALGDRLVLAGGEAFDGAKLADVQAYYPGENRWSPLPPLGCARADHGAAVIDGRLHVFGGRRTVLSRYLPDWLTRTVEILDTGENRWVAGPDLPAALAGMGVAADQRGVHLLGGKTRRALGLLPRRQVRWHLVLDGARGGAQDWAWHDRMPLPAAWVVLAAGLVGRRPFVMGRAAGAEGPVLLRLFSPQSGSWDPMPAPRAEARSLGVASDGTAIYAFGTERHGPASAEAQGTHIERLICGRRFHLGRRQDGPHAAAPDPSGKLAPLALGAAERQEPVFRRAVPRDA